MYAGEYGGDETGLFGEVVDVNAEVVTNGGLFVNLGLEGGEDRGVNVWLRHVVYERCKKVVVLGVRKEVND